MKNLLKLTVVAIIVFTTNTAANAQKIAHVNLDSLLSLMPESATAKQAAQDYYKQLENQVMMMQNELQTKYSDYQTNETKYSDIIKQTKQKELNDLNQRIQDFQTQAQQDLQKKNDDLSKPVYEKAKKAIDQVAKENSYKYVLDTSSGIVLYSEPGDDIIALVVKKLGIAITSNTPAAPLIDPKKK